MSARTSKPEYGPPMLKALMGMGRASVDELMEETLRFMRLRLHPADFEVLPGGVPRWRRQAEHMLWGLVDEGYVADSRGCLSLTKRGLEYLSGC